MIDKKGVLQVLKKLWQRKLKAILVISLTVILGVVVAFTSPSEWTSSVKFLPESSSDIELGGTLGDLAGLAGIGGLGGGGGDGWLSPDMYFDILNSGPYYRALFDEEFGMTGGKKMGVKLYFKEAHGTGLLSGLIAGAMKAVDKLKGSATNAESAVETSVDHEFFTLDEVQLIKELKGRIRLEVSRKTGMVSIRSSFQDRIFAANISRFTKEYLESYLNEFANKNDRINLEYIEGRYLESKNSFENSRKKLAEFKDKNNALRTEQLRVKQEELELQRDFDFNLYQGLALKYENAKFDVERSTARLSVIEPVTIPALRDSPKRLKIIIKSFMLGAFLSIFILLYKDIVLWMRESVLEID